MLFSPQTIALSLVDVADTTYKISTSESIEDLLASIKCIGLLSPPILKKKSRTYTIISGFKRISACVNLGWSSIDARVVDHKASDLQCTKLAIADNSVNRSLNFIEQSISISMLSNYYDDKGVIREAKGLGLNMNASLLEKLKKITQLSPELKNPILTGTISLTIALELEKMDKPSAMALSQLFESLKPTFNIQKEILTMVKEISRIEDLAAGQLLSDPYFLDIMENGEIGRNQKIQKIRYYFKKMRYPVITKFEGNFKQLLQQIDLPGEIKFIPPENFEGTRYVLVLSFQNLKEFKFEKDALDKLMRQPEFKKIFEKEIAAQKSLY